MKKKVIFRFCIVIILFISVIIIHLETTPSTPNKIKISENTPTIIPSDNLTARKIQDCFEAHLPAKYNIQYNNDSFEAVITYNGNIIQIKKIIWLVICISRQIQLVKKKWTQSLILSYTNLNSSKDRKLHLLLQYAAFCLFMRLYSLFQLPEYVPSS
ncbi:hypothetical protein SAMN04487772_11555 [[Clostridium] polysaccharolyticum]|jgi:hypothetical protein|uniref:Uncharacterized protein n=1 Tax=[Clostridium] polysaccharolyticum TaxID=29364 RepID=A0A1I0DM37_9FIRM|nr:hypothetical protein SAMN04487772_11555 [[Clostridium] polysaccharolyticum]